MTTSNDTTYELTRNQIIESAMRKGQRLAKGQSADSTDLTNGTIALNALIASLQVEHGNPLWARKDYSITLVAGQRNYTLGESQTINTPFPLKMLQVVLETTTGGSSQEVSPLAYKDFKLLNTETTGRPCNYTYQPKVNLGVLSVWPLPDATTASDSLLQITYQRPFEGFTAAGETPDLPQEWQNVLIFGLAWSMAPEWGVPPQDQGALEKAFDRWKAVALDGVEQASVFFQPDNRGD